MRATSLVAVLLLPLAVTGQAQTFDSAAQAYERLSARLRKERREYGEARAAITASAAYRAARERGDRAAVLRMLNTVPRPDELSMCRRAIEVAARFGGDDAVRLLGWAAVHAKNKELTVEVVDRVEAEHMSSPALTALLERADVIARHLGMERGPGFLQRVVDESPHDIVRAWALYWQSIAIKRRDPQAAEKLRQRAATFADGHWLADKIRAKQFKAERLQIGMVAPDIEGADADGVAFKLSDYRGKVVVLDFWGFW